VDFVASIQTDGISGSSIPSLWRVVRSPLLTLKKYRGMA
jgi:hypothetical protein